MRTVPDRHASCFIEVETSGFLCSIGGDAGTREGESISRGLHPVSLFCVCVWGGGGEKGPTHYSSVRSKLTYFFLFGLSLELSQSPPLAWTEGLCRL